ncbi:hypothetical protein [Endozoicomonas arenosclerae]|uniref:hypothetical protein n=1 Tax=Endozoicomonas arenosclerae TaxID=1633495 RepID=UPI000785BDD9|nr:hypothetical protein [Endozoicomonas arenosclerae]
MLTSVKKTAFIALTLILSGCGTATKKVTQQDFDQASALCRHQWQTDRADDHPRWFTRWLSCKSQHTMPLELKAYPHKQREIRQMYSRLMRMGLPVNEGRSKVKPVYDEWERMLRNIGIYNAACVKNRDGSRHCMPAGDSLLFVKTDEGKIISVSDLVEPED